MSPGSKTKDDKSFAYAKEIEEEQITKGTNACFQPSFSPDGKEIAYLENRTEIKVINLKSKKSRTVLPAKYNYSYQDGDQWYQWSPDGRWILAKYFEHGGWQHNDIALVKADGSGEIHNLTNSGYSDQNPKWMMNGKAIIGRPTVKVCVATVVGELNTTSMPYSWIRKPGMNSE